MDKTTKPAHTAFILGFLVVAMVILFAFFAGWQYPWPGSEFTTVSPTQIAQKALVSVSIDFGNGEVATARVTAKNAFEALAMLSREKGFDVISKQYDFGVFVDRIKGVRNNKDTAWIYSVNGKGAEIAADKYDLKEGDVVEWRYENVNKP